MNQYQEALEKAADAASRLRSDILAAHELANNQAEQILLSGWAIDVSGLANRLARVATDRTRNDTATATATSTDANGPEKEASGGR